MPPQPQLIVQRCYFRTWTPVVTTSTWLQGSRGFQIHSVTSLAESRRRQAGGRAGRPASPLPTSNLKCCLCRDTDFSKSPRPINPPSRSSAFIEKFSRSGRLPCSFSFYYEVSPQCYLEQQETCKFTSTFSVWKTFERMLDYVALNMALWPSYGSRSKWATWGVQAVTSSCCEAPSALRPTLVHWQNISRRFAKAKFYSNIPQ